MRPDVSPLKRPPHSAGETERTKRGGRKRRKEKREEAVYHAYSHMGTNTSRLLKIRR